MAMLERACGIAGGEIIFNLLKFQGGTSSAGAFDLL